MSEVAAGGGHDSHMSARRPLIVEDEVVLGRASHAKTVRRDCDGAAVVEHRSRIRRDCGVDGGSRGVRTVIQPAHAAFERPQFAVLAVAVPPRKGSRGIYDA